VIQTPYCCDMESPSRTLGVSMYLGHGIILRIRTEPAIRGSRGVLPIKMMKVVFVVSSWPGPTGAE
jgi:hypothetical protein